MSYRWQWYCLCSDNTIIKEFDKDDKETLFNTISLEKIQLLGSTNGKDFAMANLVSRALNIIHNCQFLQINLNDHIKEYCSVDDLINVQPIQLKEGHTDFHPGSGATIDYLDNFLIGFKGEYQEKTFEFIIKINQRDEKTLHIHVKEKGQNVTIIKEKIE